MCQIELENILQALFHGNFVPGAKGIVPEAHFPVHIADREIVPANQEVEVFLDCFPYFSASVNAAGVMEQLVKSLRPLVDFIKVDLYG